MKTTTNVQSGYLCHCLRITAEDFDTILQREGVSSYEALKKKYGIGSMCSSCEYEAKGILLERVTPRRRRQQARPSLSGRILGGLGRVRSLARQAVGLPGDTKPRKTYYTGIFFMRKHGLESRLAISNLRFPEHGKNINGRKVTFTASLYGAEGEKLVESRNIPLPDGMSAELTLEDLFPGFKDEFVGSLYVDFPDLVQTGSLRPYGILVNTTSPAEARCHYHDKFGYFQEPGYVQNTAPFEPGQICWMAIANCQNRPYASEACIKFSDRRLSAPISVPAMGSQWIKLEEFFGADRLPAPGERSPALFWLENPQHVMVYFFWLNEGSQTWMGQHH